MNEPMDVNLHTESLASNIEARAELVKRFSRTR